MNALLIAICQEVGVKAVLTTEVIPWARGAVREIDIARRLMHYAVTQKTLPKDVDDRLVTVKDPAILSATPRRSCASCRPAVNDPNFRIFADRRDDHRLQPRALRPGHRHPGDLRRSSASTRPPTPSTSGKELAKAKLAITLGKTYRQEGQLNWGYLTPPDDPNREHVKPTRPRAATARRRPPMAEPPLVEELDPAPDPVAAAERFLGSPISSSSTAPPIRKRLGRFSFLTAGAGGSRRAPRGAAAPVPALEQARGTCSIRASAPTPVPGLPPFQGGLAGYLAYDSGRVARAPARAALRRSRLPGRASSACTTGSSRGTTRPAAPGSSPPACRRPGQRAAAAAAERLAWVRRMLGGPAGGAAGRAGGRARRRRSPRALVSA